MYMSSDVRRKYNIFLKYKAYRLVWALGTAAAQHFFPSLDEKAPRSLQVCGRCEHIP